MAVPENSRQHAARVNKVKKMAQKPKKTGGEKDKAVIAAAQDIKYAKFLAGNEKTGRDRALKSLRKWFQQRCISLPLTESDLMIIWKGLFYSMWMSDKLLVQEECAENIAKLIHYLTPCSVQLQFFKCALKTLTNEWFGIDQLRLDKFLMLVRRLLRQAFVVLKDNKWNMKYVRIFDDILNETVLNFTKQPPLGLTMHFTEIYLEELAKVSEGDIQPYTVAEFVLPFIKQLVNLTDKRQISCITKNIFTYLLKQSNLGLEYTEKYNAWKQMGFPGGHIDAMSKEQLPDDEKMSDDEDETEVTQQKVFDPRAGKVDVILPQLQFSAKHIVKLLAEHKFSEGSNSKSRKTITKVMDQFTELSKGSYPLGAKKIEKPKDEGHSTKLKQSVNRLVKFEQNLMGKSGRKRKISENGDDVEVPMKKIKKESLQPKRVEDNEFDHITVKKTKLSKSESVQTRKEQKNVGKAINSKSKLLDRVVTKEPVDDTSIEKILNNFEAHFIRNSGTWFVYNGDNTESESESPSSPKKAKISPKKENERPTTFKEPELPNTTDTPSRSNFGILINGVTQSTVNQQTEHDDFLPSKNVFPQTEWDAPLKDGEIEFFLASKKYQKKAKSSPNKKHLVDTLTKIRGKKRSSLDPNFVRNPFPSQSDSHKKVKINLRLNKSQEVHEHVARIKSSPGIPFDAKKKPNKSLLKPNAVSSPINPFYKRKMKLLY